jgi:hypothetical protein
MTSPVPNPKPRAFTKWLDSGLTPLAAVDPAGTLQFYNDAFVPFLRPDAPERLAAHLQPPAEAWNGLPCQRHFHASTRLQGTSGEHYDQANYLPLAHPDQTIFGCLISLSSAVGSLSNPHASHALPHQPNSFTADTAVLPRASSDTLHQELLEFRRRWSDATQMDLLCGHSPLIHKTLQQVQLAVATSTPVLIRGYDLNACHDLAKGIWLQRFKRSQISSAGFQFMPISARALDGEMLRSALDLALPLTFHGEYLATCLLIEDITTIHQEARTILADWLSAHRPSQIFATEITSRDGLGRAPRDAHLEPYFAVLVIEVPSLRDRPEDIPAIATRILNHSIPPSRVTSYAFSHSAIEALIAYPWHGDYSELQTAIRQISLAPNKFIVDAADLPLAIRSYIGGKSVPTPAHSKLDLDQTLLEIEKSLLEKTLEECKGNRAMAARQLGISRPRLLRRLAQLHIAAADMEDGADSQAATEIPETSRPTPSKQAPSLKSNTTSNVPSEPDSLDNQPSEEITMIDFIPVDEEAES